MHCSFCFYLYFDCGGSLLLLTVLSLVGEVGGYSSLWCAGFSFGGFSCCGEEALSVPTLVVGACGL